MILNFLTVSLLAASPVPVGNPGEWATSLDYPIESLQKEQEGTVKFKLVIENTGIPRECTILQSSGHIPLDNRTCEVLMARARFAPAGNEGYGDTANYENQIRWSLPQGDFDLNMLKGKAPGFCGFGMSLSDPATTKFMVVQDQTLADHGRILIAISNDSWPIRDKEKIAEAIKVSSPRYSFWNNATAIENGFLLFMDATHVRKFINSYPVTAAIYRGDARIGSVSLLGLQKEYGKFVACTNARKANQSVIVTNSRPAG